MTRILRLSAGVLLLVVATAWSRCAGEHGPAADRPESTQHHSDTPEHDRHDPAH